MEKWENDDQLTEKGRETQNRSDHVMVKPSSVCFLSESAKICRPLSISISGLSCCFRIISWNLMINERAKRNYRLGIRSLRCYSLFMTLLSLYHAFSSLFSFLEAMIIIFLIFSLRPQDPGVRRMAW